ncbi:MAG: lipoxygenase family protein [Sandaracinaceae bacterium]
MKPCLPKDETAPDDRANRLAKARQAYVFDYAYHGIVSVKDLPAHDKSDLSWWAAVSKKIVELEINQLKSRSPKENLEALGSTVRGLFDKLLPDELTEKRAASRHDKAVQDREVGADQYRRMYATIEAPPVVDVWQRDDIFAWQQLAGCNPVMLRGYREALGHFPVEEAHYQRAVPGDSLAAAMAEGRLFVADYAVLDGIVTGETDGFSKYNFAPIALYARTPAGGFVPVAIQPGQEPSKLFTPADGASWRMAKNTVRCGEGNYQGVISHFALCHQVMESVIVSARRRLADNHPLRVLFEPHFANTLITNDIAMSNLIGPGGYMERLQSGTLTASLELANRSLAQFRLMDSAPSDDFGGRGVDDLNALPNYPFRDDLTTLWPLIEGFVRDYLTLYYQDAADVGSDPELAAWVREMGAADGGQLVGLTVPATPEDVVALVARIVFRCTAYHAAINYSSFDMFSYPANVMAAAFAPGPTGEGDSVEAADAMLPPFELAEAGFFLFGEIETQINQLGHYPEGHFEDPRVGPLVAAYQSQLDAAEATITERGADRLLPYGFLLPSRISNSIHV